jgi:hypothetical protein
VEFSRLSAREDELTLDRLRIACAVKALGAPTGICMLSDHRRKPSSGWTNSMAASMSSSLAVLGLTPIDTSVVGTVS